MESLDRKNRYVAKNPLHFCAVKFDYYINSEIFRKPWEIWQSHSLLKTLISCCVFQNVTAFCWNPKKRLASDAKRVIKWQHSTRNVAAYLRVATHISSGNTMAPCYTSASAPSGQRYVTNGHCMDRLLLHAFPQYNNESLARRKQMHGTWNQCLFFFRGHGSSRGQQNP